MDERRSRLVESDGSEADDNLSREEREQRDATRIKSRSSLHGFDLDAPHVVRWNKMPPEARAAGALAAMMARLELHPDLFYYDTRARVVFAVQPDPEVEGRKRGTARAVPRTVEESIAPARAAFGMSGVAILDFIKRRR